MISIEGQERPWGRYFVLHDEPTYKLKRIEVDPGGLFLAGGSGFGVAGDYPMIDPEDDGIYTVTVRRAKGFFSYYTFLNGNCGDWSCKENIEGQSCAYPDAFNDRFIPSVKGDTIIKTCFF